MGTIPGNPEDVCLDEEQRACLKRCLYRSVAEVSDFKLKALETVVAGAMRTFLARRHDYEMTYREVHDAIRELWRLASDADPPVGQIRAIIKALSDQVLRPFNYLARQEIPKYYAFGQIGRAPADERGGMPLAEVEALREGGFRAWAAIANGPALIWAIQTLLPAIGVIEVEGRSRGMGRRSPSRVEPIIMGTARGADNPMPSSKQMHIGGRRSILDFEFSLIGALVQAWQRATGILPSAGRSDETGFGDLVHSVFQWLGMDGQAEYALRQYWKEFSRS
jgi:hypothetical protein